ncbi:uncharacterized protein LOC143282961 [Babylonia areolata]|uniref:uncharacterized protein LOC143282961 n=1 Tax=Babylonia areolata TaxID=304850 RepID=UPI003FCFAC4F
MWTKAVIFSAILTVTAAQQFPPVNLSSTCAATLCVVGTVCKEVEDQNGNIQAVCVSVDPQVPAEKVGRCPAPDQYSFGICASTCSSDSDCAGSSKCCKNGCGATTCQRPLDSRPSCDTVKCGPGQTCELQQVVCVRAPCYPVPTCVERKEKPGQCRKPRPFEAGICANTCTRDSDCEGSDKCCKNGCGATVCQSVGGLLPVPSRPTCATVRCSAGTKCVLKQVQCIRAPCYPQPVCVDDTEKPGQCRKPRPFESGICANTCTRDSDCEGSDKCCKNGCGATVCQSVEGQTLVRPQPTCDTVKCKAGHKCVMRVIYCVTTPCPSPFPECVPDPDKQGVCPKPRFSLSSWFCRSRCQSDVECPGAQKCCPSYCGSRCQDPKPAPLPKPGQTCKTVDCGPDQECVMKRQCGKLGCSSRPECEPVKRCPFFPAWINPHCVRQNTCSENDPNSCFPGQICCSTDCGRRCVRPLQ